MTVATSGAKKRHGFDAYLKPKTLVMLALGFSSGLPFLLVGNTFGYWLRDEGAALTAIGFLSWVGIAYSLKFLWAPIIDRTLAPVAGKLGRRRGWMLLAQLFVCAALIAMGIAGTSHGLVLLGMLALVVAFSSSTQDIVIDAWRIEIADDADELGLLSSAYQLGYRAALLATDALILIAAQHLSWPVSYVLYGLLMIVGIAATFFAREPKSADAVMSTKETLAPLWTPRGFLDAVIGPFIAFFKAHGVFAFLMLAAISLYRLPDFVMGPMANPFYHDIGLTKDVVGTIRASVGLIASLIGIAAGGFAALRFGYMRALIAGGFLQVIAVAAYAVLAYAGNNLEVFACVMALDSFAMGFAGVALVSYMSSLTSLGYTATQYALLASTYAWAGKILKGFSGAIVEWLSASHGLINAYAIFFIGAGLIGVPAILLFALLNARQKAAASAIS
jgi:PAT family beta-lactamase induction signal transducer AmpG